MSMATDLDRDFASVLARLGRSRFRSRFAIRGKELDYLRRLGSGKLRAHARDLVGKRLAPAQPANDGRQTPTRNHPVFVAQHATATCCRGCLRKWHGIPRGRELTAGEVDWIVGLIAEYCGKFVDTAGPRIPIPTPAPAGAGRAPAGRGEDRGPGGG